MRPNEAQPDIDSSRVLVFGWLLQRQAHFVLVASETFGPQNTSPLFIIVANIGSSVLCIYLKYALQALKYLCLDLL